MRQKLGYIICGLVLLANIALTHADTSVDNLATASVAVSSQSAGDLHPALINAFIQSLIKISGNTEIGSVTAIKEQFPRVERFVQKYTYNGLTVTITFDRRALIALLTQAGQSVWSTKRPAVMIWLSKNGQNPIAKADADPIIAIFENNAERRGLPFTLPEMDKADQIVWQTMEGGSSVTQDLLEKIAEHYQAPAILFGQIQQGIQQVWIAQWFFVWRAQTWQWHNEALTQEAVVQAGVDKIADLMAKQLAVNLDQQPTNNLWMAVLDVNNLEDYSQVLSALKQLTPVMAISVQDVGTHGLLVRVTTTGEGNLDLKNALVASHHFTPLANQAFADVLHYRWTP